MVDLVAPMVKAEAALRDAPLDKDKISEFYRLLGGLQWVAEQAIKQRTWRGGRIR